VWPSPHRLHTYVSFSGPHLGMLYTSNLLVELGVWGLRKWKHAHCLTELSLKDAKVPFMYVYIYIYTYIDIDIDIDI